MYALTFKSLCIANGSVEAIYSTSAELISMDEKETPNKTPQPTLTTDSNKQLHHVQQNRFFSFEKRMFYIKNTLIRPPSVQYFLLL